MTADGGARHERRALSGQVMNRLSPYARIWAFIASLLVAFVVLSVLTDRGATRRVARGTVAELHAGEWMLVTNGGMRLPVTLREKTSYEGNPAEIRPGVRVTVWYRGVGEGRPIADKVRVLP